MNHLRDHEDKHCNGNDGKNDPFHGKLLCKGEYSKME